MADKPSQTQTAYVVLARTDTGWEEVSEGDAFRGQPGTKAIKDATKRADGSFAPGRYKAVPRATWEADGNNLEIETETKSVSTFKTPGKAKASAVDGLSDKDIAKTDEDARRQAAARRPVKRGG